MINPPAPPEIPRPTMQDFNAMVARSTTSLNQVQNHIDLTLALVAWLPRHFSTFYSRQISKYLVVRRPSASCKASYIEFLDWTRSFFSNFLEILLWEIFKSPCHFKLVNVKENSTDGERLTSTEQVNMAASTPGAANPSSPRRPGSWTPPQATSPTATVAGDVTSVSSRLAARSGWQIRFFRFRESLFPISFLTQLVPSFQTK